MQPLAINKPAIVVSQVLKTNFVQEQRREVIKGRHDFTLFYNGIIDSTTEAKLINF